MTKAKKKRKSNAGRPKKQVSARAVQALAKIGCTNAEMADALDVSPDTLERNYAAAIKRGRDTYRLSIRRQLTKLSNAGNPGCTIFLAKSVLGMRETVQVTTPAGEPIQAAVQDVTLLSPAERKRRIAELAKKAQLGTVAMVGDEVIVKGT